MSSHRVAVVTGASRGIGLATAHWFALRGWSLAICSRNELELNNAAEQIRNRYDIEVFSAVADIASPPSMSNFVEGCLGTIGAPTSIVCNAAVLGPTGSITSIDTEQVRTALETNVFGVFNTIQAFCREISQLQGLRLVVLAGGGLGGDFPLGGVYAYTPAKAFCVSLVEVLSREFDAFGAAICAVSPGMVGTSFLLDVKHSDAKDLPDDLVEAAIQQESMKGSDSELKPYFKILEFFHSEKGALLNGRMISANRDSIVDLSLLNQHNDLGLFRMRRIDGSRYRRQDG